MKVIERRTDLFEVIYDLEYRPMTNEEIYEGLMRSDFSRKKVRVVKSIEIARVAR
jgi:hypothetical protein